MESGLPIFQADFTCPLVLRILRAVFSFHLQDSHLLWLAFPHHSVTIPQYAVAVQNPDHIATIGLASSAFARRYLQNLFDFFSYGYLDVSLPRVPFVQLCIHCTITGSSPAWFPNSEICGSTLIYSSPQLIAVSHVLHRLLMPRHSPCALIACSSSFELL